MRVVRVGLCLLVLGAASCGGSRGETTLVFWHFWPQAAVDPLLREFESLHPGLRVESQQLTWQSGFEKIVLAFASDTAPDLLEVGSTWVAKLAADGSLSAFPDRAAAVDSAFFLAEPGVLGGRVYALPWLVGTRALFVNRDLFRRAGLDPDRPPATWSELRAAAAAVRALGANVYGFGTNAGERHVLYKKFLPFAWSNGGSVLDTKGRPVLDSPENLEALRFVLDLAKDSIIEKQTVLDQLFREGRVGMILSGSWNLKSLPEEAPGLDFGVALMPRPDRSGSEGVSFGGAEMLAVPASSRHAEDARALSRFLLEPARAWRIAREVRSVWPSARGAADDAGALDPREEVFLRQMRATRTPPTHPQWVDMEGILDTHLERALYGKSTPEEALREADEEIRALLAETEERPT